jgi:hypothetical protein
MTTRFEFTRKRTCRLTLSAVERFRERFGGEFLDPKDRSKWPGSKQ